ncbi:hypothetical protein SAMN05444166_4211 [Singulisphaera sp. GP187]|uniref:hypothetical protein n=1 Tax=Singulisphaera sp. GP187 TaxID=1882752 RepID=UPI000925CED8|nr:hypothetical protein [Singulisphaera sp. GP187]SIO37705.1 hypothetical protein SAMN05444166_4211 [Singulisphaera sp. GP187]
MIYVVFLAGENEGDTVTVNGDVFASVNQNGDLLFLTKPRDIESGHVMAAFSVGSWTRFVTGNITTESSGA